MVCGVGKLTQALLQTVILRQFVGLDLLHGNLFLEVELQLGQVLVQAMEQGLVPAGVGGWVDASRKI